MNAPDVTLYQLRVLAAIVEHGSFTAAADSLHLSQPAVSAQIRHLRRFAGAPVLVRDGRGIVLTEAGRALYRYAGEMLWATEALRRDLKDIAMGERDQIVVAGSLAYSTYVLPGILSRFQLMHPTTRISLVDAASPDVVDRVRGGWADLGVVVPGRVRKELLADILVAELCEDEPLIVEAASRPFTGGRPLTLAQLANLPFVRIARAGTSIEAPLNNVLAAAGLEQARTVMQFTTSEGTKDAVRAGVGVAVMFRSSVRRELERGELAVMTVSGYSPIPARVDLICSPHRRNPGNSPVFGHLLEFLQREFPRVLQEPATNARSKN